MKASPHTKTGNRLLDALPAKSLARLQPHFKPAAFVVGAPLHTDEHIYFPIAGMISVVAVLLKKKSVEIGIVGREGMHSVAAFLDEDTPFQSASAQLPGHARRLKTRLF